MSNNSFLLALESYLLSQDSPENCLMLSDLDGFLHGVICSPERIPLDEWLPLAIGAAPTKVPSWVIDDITDLYIGIATDLAAEPPIVDPIFWQARSGKVIAKDWCEGFTQAIALRPKAWQRITESGTHGHLLALIVCHMRDDKDSSIIGIPPEMLDEMLANGVIEDAVAKIFTFW